MDILGFSYAWPLTTFFISLFVHIIFYYISIFVCVCVCVCV